ncbi:MAG: mechanosensitive ion channel family protein [Bacteroidia bacterium]|nr:mechanosensitive ion channel family protein [Bacteroidia bacterium]
MVENILHRTLLGNSIESYCWFAGIVLLGLIFQRLLSKLLTLFVFKVVQKYSTEVGFEKLLALTKKPMRLLILLITFYIAFDRLDFPIEWNIGSIEHFGLRMTILRAFQVGIAISITWIILRIVDFFGLILMHRASLTESKTDDQLVPFIKEAIKVIVVILSIFFTLGAVFKLNIASLIAGLGIGGLAIALAAKESLENLLGSFTIFLDKPFVIGDLIRIGSLEGHVEKIGFRSTRIRTLEKSYVTVPNKKLVDSELDNLSLRIQRRAKFDVGLTYDTPSEKIKLIVADIQKYIESHAHILKEETRVRLNEFGSSSINIMVLYFVDTLEYDVYLDVREEINYKIIEIVNAHGSSFAYPTTTVLVKK